MVAYNVACYLSHPVVHSLPYMLYNLLLNNMYSHPQRTMGQGEGEVIRGEITFCRRHACPDPFDVLDYIVHGCSHQQRATNVTYCSAIAKQTCWEYIGRNQVQSRTMHNHESPTSRRRRSTIMKLNVRENVLKGKPFEQKEFRLAQYSEG